MIANHRYVFLGPQGSGKGTQADFLATKLNIPHLSTGQLFREEVARATDSGKEMAAKLANGQLISDEITNKLVAEWLASPAAQNGFILDGYPRNLIQAKFLDGITEIYKVVLLDLSEDEAVRRLQGRRQCSKCGAMYNTFSRPPKVENICDACGAILIQRDDDTESSIRQRLHIYHEETEPLINFYKNKNILLSINGEPSAEEVFVNLCKALNL